MVDATGRGEWTVRYMIQPDVPESDVGSIHAGSNPARPTGRPGDVFSSSTSGQKLTTAGLMGPGRAPGNLPAEEILPRGPTPAARQEREGNAQTRKGHRDKTGLRHLVSGEVAAGLASWKDGRATASAVSSVVCGYAHPAYVPPRWRPK